MSHYTTVKTKIKSKIALLNTLKTIGFLDDSIKQSNNKPFVLQDNYGGKPHKAHIKVSGINGLGFELQENGCYAMHVYQSANSKMAKKLGVKNKWQDRFLQIYGKEVVKEVIQSNPRYFVENEHEENGELYLTIGTSF